MNMPGMHSLSEPLCLIKFTESPWASRFEGGNLYVTHAGCTREIEKSTTKKGYGDRFEASMLLYMLRGMLQSHETGEVFEFGEGYAPAIFALADNIPFLCLYSCDQSDVVPEENAYRIKLTDEAKKCIVDHFDKADTAVVIENPKVFAQDILNFDAEAVISRVKYFNVFSDGSGNPIKSLDMGFMSHLVQDTPVEKTDGARTYSFRAPSVYRLLECKDVIFADEKETRVILPQVRIEAPREFFIPIRSKMQRVTLDQLFDNEVLISK